MNWLPVSLFLLGFSSLFPLINPIGTALIVNSYFSGSTISQRKSFSLSISLYCFLLGLAVLFTGSWVLKAMGISVSTTQMAGGLLIARMGLGLLSSAAPSETKLAPQEHIKSLLFYPLSFPLTLGPGGISALITLSAHAHTGAENITEIFLRMAVCAMALLVVLTITYFCFVYSQSLIQKIGSSGSLVLNRLMAFIVFCIGIQMFVTGLTNSFPSLFR